MQFDEIKKLISIEPFYQTDNIMLYNADCLNIIKLLPDKCIDLILTDVPYGIHTGLKTGFIASRYKKRGTWNKKDELIKLNEWDKLPDKIYFDEMFRISINQILWGFQYFIEYLKNSKEIWIWDKKTGKSFFADCELAWTSYHGTTRKFEYQWCGCFKPDRTENSLHPTMKPFKLFQWCLRNSKENDIILDCFAGSSTTGIACMKLNRKCILIEKELKYCEISKERLIHAEKERANEFYIPESENLLFK